MGSFLAFFFNTATTVFLLIFKFLPIYLTPLLFRVCSIINSLISGLRINTIKRYANYDNNSLLFTKVYTYKNSDNASSGVLLNTPRYCLTYSANLTNSNITDNNITFRSDNLNEFNNIYIERENMPM